MATREKKARSVTADSPTPSLGSAHSGSNSNISTIGSSSTTTTGTPTTTTTGGGDAGGSISAPTTPTSSRKGVGATPGANVNSAAAGGGGNSVSGGSGGSTTSPTSTTRASLSRLKSKQLLLTDEPPPATTVDDTVALSGSEASSSTATTPSRTTRRGGSIARDDLIGTSEASASSPTASGATASSNRDKEDMPQSVATSGASKDHTRSPAIGARRAAAAAAAVAAATAVKATKKPIVAGKKQSAGAGSNRKHHRVVSLKRTTLLKRKGKKIIGKPILGKKAVARRQLTAAAATIVVGKSSVAGNPRSGSSAASVPVKKEATITTSPTTGTTGSAKEEAADLLSTPSLRNGKPRNSDSPVAKRKSVGGSAAALKQQRDISNKTPDPAPLVASIKIERRRSGSVSKVSSEDGGADGASAGYEFKRELLDDDVRSKMLDKMAEAFNGRKLEVTTPPGGGTLRRSMRQRKSTTRDKEEFVAPRLKGAGSLLDIKVEPEDEVLDGGVATESIATTTTTAPLTIETCSSEEMATLAATSAKERSSPNRPIVAADSGSVRGEGGEDGSAGGGGGVASDELVGKDPSLSPELISEGVSELSVKECYSEPAFLENNLGIEKDPKLGEIVQGRFRCDKVSDDSGGACEEDEAIDEEVGEIVQEQEQGNEDDEVQEVKTDAIGGGGGHEDEEEVEESVVVEATDEEEVKDVEESAGAAAAIAEPSVEIVAAAVAVKTEADHEDDEVAYEEGVEVEEVRQPDEGVAIEDDQMNVDEERAESVSEMVDDAVDEAMEDEEDMEVVVELESGKADSDSETLLSMVAAAPGLMMMLRDEDEVPDAAVDEQDDVPMADDAPPSQEIAGKGPLLEDLPPTSSKTATTDKALVEIASDGKAEADETNNREEKEKKDGGKASEDDRNGEAVVVGTTPQTGSSTSLGRIVEGNGIVAGASGELDEGEQSTTSSNQQSPPRPQKPSVAMTTTTTTTTTVAVGSSPSPGSAAATTPKAKSPPAGTNSTISSSNNSTSSSTGTNSSSGKEGGGSSSKPKSRPGKEKPKEDEKTREEKLRQEKLRVEEKVREEKLRAELRLKEELQQKQQQQQKKKDEAIVLVLENGTGEEVSSAAAKPADAAKTSPAAGEKPLATTTPMVADGVASGKQLKTDAAAVTALNALPAITIVKKDSGSASPKRKPSSDAAEVVSQTKTIKAELEILPIPAVEAASTATPPATPAREEKEGASKEVGVVVVPPASVDSVESPLQIISKSEQAAAAVTVAQAKPKGLVDGLAGAGKSPLPPLTSSSSSSSVALLTIIKVESGVDEPTAEGSGEDDAPKDGKQRNGSSGGAGEGVAGLVAQLPADKASTVVVGGAAKEEALKVSATGTGTGTATALLLLDESDDVAKKKESHLKHLGLLTIRAACEEKQRRAEQKPVAGELIGDGGAAGGAAGSTGGDGGWLAGSAIGQSGSGSGSSSGSGSGRNGNKSSRSSRDEYTVSMKTVLGKGAGGGGSGRGEKRKQQRMPLKMTFQKGKGKGSSGAAAAAAQAAGSSGGVARDASGSNGSNGSNGSAAASIGGGYTADAGANNGDAFYTIHSNELDHHSSNSSDGHSHRDSAGSGGGRKAHSRSHTTDGVNLGSEAVGESSSTDKVIQKALVIPEKASSFNVHPERLCQDQCFYCGGKFGLYDTPCHIAAIKSTERQQKILLAESKITLESCLCDACFRHVDRKANYPSQKKKTTSSSAGGPQQNSSASSSSSGGGSSSSAAGSAASSQSTVSPIVIKMTTNKDGSTSIAGQQNHHQPMVKDDGSGGPGAGKAREICAVRQCTAHAMQSLRRKWVLKMKRKIGKQLDINLEQAARATTENISICNRHYEQISHLMICAMCTRPLQRNHVYHMYNNIPQLERLIHEQGLAIKLSSSELVVCKLCRHYANLLFKPPDPKSQKAQFISNYNRRLCSLRQRDETKEQNEQQQDVLGTVQSVETTPASSLAANSDGEDGGAVARRQSMVDIVISDGDEEEDDDEDAEVEVYRESQQQQQQQKLTKVGELFSIGENSVSLRRRGSSRKSPDVSIIENTSVAQMSDRLGEITIIPTTKSFASTNVNQQQQRDDNFDMTRALKSNPNISMRELFPGEEELGVNVNIPFSTSSTRTPEGWTKVTSTIQYDDSTRTLWEELQKPYGNQSSFLRHLILLEKYFRNGDLVLSPLAKTNATTYSEAVQNRLRSFDNVPTPSVASPPALASLTNTSASLVPSSVSASGGAQSADKTNSIFQQFSSATITIVPASKVRPKAPSAQGATNSGSGSSGSSSNNTNNSNLSDSSASVSPIAAPVSLLKSNNLRLSISEKVAANSLKRKLSNEGKGAVANPAESSSGGIVVAKVAKVDEAKTAASAPPELISINRKSNIPITTIPTACLTASSAAAVAALSVKQQQQSLLQPAHQSQSNQASAKRLPPSYAASTAGASAAAASTSSITVGSGSSGGNTSGTSAPTIDQRDVIYMPEQLTESEREETSSKPWRPTLLPIAPGATESLKYGPLYQTADGRLLPMLVQVMSGGKPYHISIDDYNRMCIMRREKLIQQQQNITQSTTSATASSASVTMAKRTLPAAARPTASSTASSSASSLNPPALRLPVSASDNSPLSTGATTITATNVSGGARLVQLPNQILEQNSLIPISGGSSLGGTGSSSRLSMGNQSAQKHNTSSSLMVTMTTSISSNNNNSLAKTNNISTANSVKPLTLPKNTTVYPMVISANTISIPSASSSSSSSSSNSNSLVGNSGSSASSLGLMFPQASSSIGSGRANAGGSSLVLSQQQQVTASTSIIGHNTTTTVNVSSASKGSSSASASTTNSNNPLDQLLKGGKHVTQSQLQAFAAAAAASGITSNSLLDSSPAQLLSKIPKSLTVIPQQKQRSMSRVSSHEDHYSA